MVRAGLVLMLLLWLAGVAAAQTPTPTATLSYEASIYATVVGGQVTRFDYVATAQDVQISNLLFLLFVSIWGFGLFGIFVYWRGGRK